MADPNEKVTVTHPNGGTATMSRADWERMHKNRQGGAGGGIDAPSMPTDSGGWSKSGADIQQERLNAVGQNAIAISKWKQQEETRKGQERLPSGFPISSPSPIDPNTGRTPIPTFLPVPQFYDQPDFVPKFPSQANAMQNSQPASNVSIPKSENLRKMFPFGGLFPWSEQKTSQSSKSTSQSGKSQRAIAAGNAPQPNQKIGGFPSRQAQSFQTAGNFGNFFPWADQPQKPQSLFSSLAGNFQRYS
jgi:hypothetical protein